MLDIMYVSLRNGNCSVQTYLAEKKVPVKTCQKRAKDAELRALIRSQQGRNILTCSICYKQAQYLQQINICSQVKQTTEAMRYVLKIY